MEPSTDTGENAADMDAVARFYVKCVLWLGEHDPNFVETYFGPEAVQEEALTVSVPPDRVAGYAADLLATLDRIEPGHLDDPWRRRRAYLQGMIRALESRAAILAGKRPDFDAEVRSLFGIAAPEDDPDYYGGLHTTLDSHLPGTGDLASRYRGFMESFLVPADRLETVFAAAFAESRRRTAEHLPLPAGEHLEVAAVSGEGCSRYQGGGRSLVGVSTTTPITIDRVLSHACRQGYPGRHTIRTIREAALVRVRGWIEHSVIPLASPFTTVAEGASLYGEEMIFPDRERVRFYEEVLFPLTGFDPADAGLLDTVAGAAAALEVAGNARVARGYLASLLSREEACRFLQDVLLLDREGAEARLRFIEEFRGYPVAIFGGCRLVREYVGSGTDRWERFARILTDPVLPGDLTPGGTS